MQEDNLKRKVISGLFWRYMERTLAQGIQLLVTIVLARILMPEEYGTVALISVLINIALVFVQNGFGNALIQKANADSTDFSTAFYFSLGLSLIIYLILYVTAPYVSAFYRNSELTPLIRGLSVSIIIASMGTVQQAYVSRTMQFRKFFFSTLTGTIVSAFTGIGAALMGLGAWALIIQQLTNQSIDTLILWFTSGWRLTKEFSAKSLRHIFTYGWKLLVSGLIDTVYSNLYTLIIGKKFSAGDVGYYEKGRQFPALIIMNVNATIQSVLFPALSSQQSDRARTKAMTRRAIKTSTFVIFPCMAGLSVIARPLVVLVLTEKWLPAVSYLRFFCLIYAIWPVHTANLQAINALGRSDIFLKLEIIKKTLGITVLFITIPMGLRAMMIGSCIVCYIGMILNASPNIKLLNYSLVELARDLMPSALLSAFMSAVILCAGSFIGNDLIKLLVQTLLGVCVYAGTAALIRAESFIYIMDTIRGIGKKRG
jgi:O-antigen/teichoic acid export membrane protein